MPEQPPRFAITANRALELHRARTCLDFARAWRQVYGNVPEVHRLLRRAANHREAASLV